MSTEQSEKSETPQAETKQVDITQQATTPTATPKHVKNPKRVAAGKAVAEKTRLAREQQKKAAAEAAIIIANNRARASNPVAVPEPDPPSTLLIADDSNLVATPKSNKVDNSSLNITQWIGVAGIVVSLVGIYYKREELKALFNKKKTPEPQPVRTTLNRGVKHLD